MSQSALLLGGGSSEATGRAGFGRAELSFCQIGRTKIAAASAPAGISVLSAYAEGRGSVVAIARRITVGVCASGGCCADCGTDPIADARRYLVECAGQMLGSHKNELRNLTFSVNSHLPQGCGLKTSAAVGVATCGASAEAWQEPIETAKLVRASAEAAKRCGVTQAGSLDDVWCAVAGGVVVADENSGRLIDKWRAPEDIDVTIFIPALRAHAAHFADRRVLMRPHAGAFRELSLQLLETRDILKVMTAASYLTADAFGYGRSLLDLGLKAGALGVSLSGKGPAIAALTETGGASRVAEAWSHLPGRIIHTSLENDGLRSEVPFVNASHSRVCQEERL